ncbi:hypothetical protein [Acidicapsa acidisoli]|uniref:hypothetical protein n=1 Tax=Acidicapsa acidisoli TaxID=1615681 RepID=UPI0021E0379F|nr:hypothetical protein [Acidicapsa acidisoli]
MSDESDQYARSADLAAAQLVEFVKRMDLDHLEVPVIDGQSAWEVTVKKLGIRSNPVLE